MRWLSEFRDYPIVAGFLVGLAAIIAGISILGLMLAFLALFERAAP